ncbi:MAG TPA: TauD/TfdA family dioxygenase [Sphingomonadaceae bacterium]|nr:TauD/TfdA family dioxygenase [Sphingomonadaceae bacterium]
MTQDISAETPVLRPIREGFVVEVSGLDMTRPLAPETEALLRDTIEQAGVVVIRNAEPPGNEAHIAFARHFGHVGRAKTTISGGPPPRIPFPEITDVSNLAPDGGIQPTDARRALFQRGDRLWHTDYSFVANRATWSMLAAHEVPPEGGDTDYADMRAAYRALPAALRERIAPLVAEHSIWHSRVLAGFPEPTREELASQPPARHPLVHLHHGQPSLYIASHAARIVGMDEAEGRALIDELIAFATQPAFTYSHKWRRGDLLIWDNLATMHRATAFASDRWRRDMRRVTLREQPVA